MLEAYKTFRGLIYLLLIGGLVVFLVLSLKSDEQKQAFVPDSVYMRLLEERAQLKAKTEILEFQTAQLSGQLSDLLKKETGIKQYFSGKKQAYSGREISETDREFLETFK